MEGEYLLGSGLSSGVYEFRVPGVGSGLGWIPKPPDPSRDLWICASGFLCEVLDNNYSTAAESDSGGFVLRPKHLRGLGF